MKRASVPGRANDDVENIIGITPELFTCITNVVRYNNIMIDIDKYMSLFACVCISKTLVLYSSHPSATQRKTKKGINS